MAKIDLKLDWQALLLQHGEKAGVSIVALIVIMMVWAAIGREGMPVNQQPADIAEVATRAEQNIASTTWDDFPDRPELKSYGNRSIMDQINREPFKIAHWDRDIFPQKNKRQDPTLYPVEDLHVGQGVGAFALSADDTLQRSGVSGRSRIPGVPDGVRRRIRPNEAGALLGGSGDDSDLVEQPLVRALPSWYPVGGIDTGGGARVEGRRWVTVTGLVPIAKQRDEYFSVFSESEGYRSDRDTPEYLGAFVERAEIVNGQPTDWKMMMAMSSKSIEIAIQPWSSTAQPHADERYVHPDLTYPLGPRLLEDWERSVVHPKIPLAPTEEQLRQFQEAEDPGGHGDQPEEGTEFDPFARRNDELSPERSGRYGERRPGGSSQSEFRRRAALMERGTLHGARRGGSRAAGSEQEDPYVEHYLFRFFDFTVQPGKEYVYRVRLVVQDPNSYRDPVRRIADKDLDTKVLQRLGQENKGYVRTPWSDVSPAVKIPFDGDVLAAGVTAVPQGRYTAEPKAEVLVETFDAATGRHVNATAELYRGGVTNFAKDVHAVDPAARQLVEQKQYPVATDHLLLDLRGGERLARRNPGLVAPAEVLLVDRDGNLFVRTEVASRQKVADHRSLVKIDEPKSGGGVLGAGDPGYEEGGLFDQPDQDRPRTRSPRTRTNR